MRSFKYYKVLNPRHVLSQRNPNLLYRVGVRSGFQSGTIRIGCGTKLGSGSQFVIAIRSSFRVRSRIDPGTKSGRRSQFVIANWSSFRAPIRIDPDRLRNEVGLWISVCYSNSEFVPGSIPDRSRNEVGPEISACHSKLEVASQILVHFSNRNAFRIDLDWCRNAVGV